MTPERSRRRPVLWFGAATVFTAINVVWIPIAAAMREPGHARTHAVLAAIGAYVMWRMASRRSDAASAPEREAASVDDADARIQRLQESVDAIALEVERIGEAQRFSAKLAAKLTRDT